MTIFLGREPGSAKSIFHESSLFGKHSKQGSLLHFARLSLLCSGWDCMHRYCRGCAIRSILSIQAFLGVAFLVEGLLFGFHLKGTALDMKVHFILVMVVLANSATCFLEIASPHNFLLTTARAQLTMLQVNWRTAQCSDTCSIQMGIHK